MEQLSLFTPLSKTERQKEGIREWIKHGCKGSWVWCTGMGKTYATIMAMKVLTKKIPNLRTLIVVPTEGLKTQWETKLLENQLSGTVLIINTAVKQYREADLLVIDEIHRAGAETFAKIFETIKYKYILGLTATLERLDGRHLLIQKYCPEIDRISTIEAVANNWLAENVEYKIILDVPDIDKYQELTKEFNEHFEFFRHDFALATSMLGKEGYKKRSTFRDELCKLNPHLDRTETFKLITYHATALARVLQARKKFINEHPKKLELTREIIKYRPDSKIITFSATIDIAEKIGVGKVYSSKDTKKKGRMTLEEFKVAECAVLNTSKRADEGLDVKGLNVAIILGQDSSPTRFTQRKGRTIRKEGDKISEIFVFVINGTVETTWWESSHRNEDKSKVISVDEANLLKILRGEEYETYKKPVSKFTFRF